MNPRVSIVIPVYNGSNYLKEAIDSALAQTYKNIEIIVVNDGSNDNGATEKIAKSYGKKIRYYKKKNGGVATALNLGIEKMTGDYFSWLSHDDMYYPKKIEKQIEFLQHLTDRKVVLYSNYALLIEGGINPIVLSHEMLERKKRYSLLRGAVNGVTVLIPKIIINELGLFKKELRCTQDYDYWLRIQERYDFVHMRDILSVTRIHTLQDSAISSNVVKEGNLLWIKMIKNLPDKEKILYESTLYNFYFEMIKFLKNTPYNGALEYCEKELDKIKSNISCDNLKFKVSVVIPFHNRVEKTINSIKSVQSQTYKNIEIILVNDASTEDISLVDDYINGDKNITLINLEKNSGPAKARNIGICAASGDYIAFLDSDDEFVKEKIQYQLFEMSKHNLDVSYTPYIRRQGGNDVAIMGYGLSGIVVPNIISNCPIATPTVMIRKEILIDGHIFFNELIRIGEDTCFWLEIAKKHELLFIDNPLTVVNTNDSSHAYDDDKMVIGIRNILDYLTSDLYYRNYYNEISLLCNYFYSINQNIVAKSDINLKINGYSKSRFRQTFIGKIKGTLLYSALRKARREGIAGVLKAIFKRIKRVTNV